jgi:hypothetical protein
MHKVTATVALALSLGLVGCVGDAPGDPGSTDPGTDPGTGPGTGPGGMSVATFLTKMGKLECDKAFECKASYPTTNGTTFEQDFGASTTACYAQADQIYQPAAVAAEVAAGKIHYDATAATACVTGVTFPACATYFSTGPMYPSACGQALVGTVADGGACVVDFDCVGGSICDATTLKCGPAPAAP